MMSRSLLGSKVTDVTGVRDEDYAANLVCILCTRKGVTPKSDEVVLSTFPLDYYLCRSWVKMVGIKELAQMPIKKLNEKLFLCQSHFHPKCFVKKNNSIFLIAEAVPTEELYYRMLPDSALADFAREEYKQQRIEDKLSEEAVKKKDSDTVELYRCIICDGNSKPDQSSLLSRFPIEPEVTGSERRRRVTLAQLEVMLKFLDCNKEVIVSFNKSAQDRGYHKRMWKLVAKSLNSHTDGAVKDWKAWSSYWTDYKGKIKRKVTQVSEAGLNDIEHRYLVMLKKAYENGGPNVQSFLSHSNTAGTGDESIDSSSGEDLGPELRRERLESGETESATSRPSRHRVTLAQLELLLEFVNSHKEIANGTKKTAQDRGYARRVWESVTQCLNSQEEGAVKNWKGWAKYWTDYRVKIKKKVSRGSEEALNEIETRFLSLMKKSDNGRSNIEVPTFPSSSYNIGVGEDPLGSSSDEETRELQPEEVMMEVELPPEGPARVVTEVAPAPEHQAQTHQQWRRRRQLRHRRQLLIQEARRRQMITIERERNQILKGYLERIANALDRCRVWVKRLGLEELASMSARELHKTRFLCEAHFDPSCIAPTTKYFRSYSLPDRNLPNPPLDNSLIENYSEIEERAVIRKHQRVLAMTRNPRYYPKRGPSLDECADDPKENLNESSVDLNDIKFAEVESELELLSEDTDYATADGQPHSDAPDEIDSLFSNYAERYRKLSTSNQAMLRSDLEQLIGRYEVKNSAVTILPYKHLVISDTKKPVVIDKPQKIEASVTPVQLPPPFENTPTKPRPLVKRIINIPTAKNQAFSKDTIKRICDPAPALKSDLIFVPGNVRKLKRTNTVPNTTFKLVKVASLTAPEDVMILDSSTGLFKSPSLLKTQSWPSGTARVLHDYAAT